MLFGALNCPQGDRGRAGIYETPDKERLLIFNRQADGIYAVQPLDELVVWETDQVFE
jgi:hypothetical protein